MAECPIDPCPAISAECRGVDTVSVAHKVVVWIGDLLETITHDPLGNIINVYTTFPWPALCAEVAKLKIEKVPAGITKTWVAKPTLTGPVLNGDARSLATGLATAQINWRKRWTKSATPAGFELESLCFSKTKRDATLAGKSPILRSNPVFPRVESCRLESSRDAESRHSDGTLNGVACRDGSGLVLGRPSRVVMGRSASLLVESSTRSLCSAPPGSSAAAARASASRLPRRRRAPPKKAALGGFRS